MENEPLHKTMPFTDREFQDLTIAYQRANPSREWFNRRADTETVLAWYRQVAEDFRVGRVSADDVRAALHPLNPSAERTNSILAARGRHIVATKSLSDPLKAYMRALVMTMPDDAPDEAYDIADTLWFALGNGDTDSANALFCMTYVDANDPSYMSDSDFVAWVATL